MTFESLGFDNKGLLI